MRPRVLILLLVLVAVLAGVLILGPERGSEREEGDEEAPIVAPSRVAESGGEPRVVLDSMEIRRIGLKTAALSPARFQGGRRLPGQVIPEPERTVAVRAPVAGRLSVTQGSPWPSLGERLKAGAPLGRVSDAQPLTVPIAGAVTAVGARPGEIVEAGQMLLELADNSHPVVRVAWPAEAGRPAQRVVLLPAGGTPVDALLIGPAPAAPGVPPNSRLLRQLSGSVSSPTGSMISKDEPLPSARPGQSPETRNSLDIRCSR